MCCPRGLSHLGQTFKPLQRTLRSLTFLQRFARHHHDFAPLINHFNNDPRTGPLKLPGFGYPVDEDYVSADPTAYIWEYDPTTTGFSHGFSSWAQTRRNLVRELHMIWVMDVLTDKPRWDIKVWNENILAKWKDEAMNMKGRLISGMTWDWIVKELRWKAVSYWRTGYLTTLETGSTIVKSDKLIDKHLRRELQRAVQPLLQVNDTEQDWHPGSDGKVLNLVHPSLYPLVYGSTKILTDCTIDMSDCLSGGANNGVVLTIPKGPVLDLTGKYGNELYDRRYPYPDIWSTKFQWLPSDVEFVGSTGNEVKLVSYINNLNPNEHQHLYHTIEKMITKSIEPWNEVLRWNEPDEHLLRIRHTDEIEQTPEPPDFLHVVEWDDPGTAEDAKQQVIEYLSQPDNPDFLHVSQPYAPSSKTPFDNSFKDDWWHDSSLNDALYEKWERIRRTSHPEPGVDKSFEQWKEARSKRLRPTLQDMFRTRGLQVIVKLSSIVLTPDKPSYDGGNWHLEGKMNEHIVATSIYYYDVENVTESHVQFRQETNFDDSWDVEYDAGNHGPIEDAYGARNLWDAEAIQDIGSVETRQGRLLVFPNIVQHRVEPFRLKDPTKPGHRRFLVLWLVDPHYRVISTKNVLPQQWEWWTQQNGRGNEEAPTDGPMKRADAERLRKDLMAERTTVMDAVEGNFQRYNFCEH